MKKLMFTLVIAILFLTGCFKYNYLQNTATNKYFNLNDTVSIQAKQTLINQTEGISITFDSVKNDSRCPIGVLCIWAGTASAVFHYTKNYNSVYFTLYTMSTFRNDTTIDNYNIQLINLSPYPSVNKQIIPDEYVSKIMVRKIN